MRNIKNKSIKLTTNITVQVIAEIAVPPQRVLDYEVCHYYSGCFLYFN